MPPTAPSSLSRRSSARVAGAGAIWGASASACASGAGSPPSAGAATTGVWGGTIV
ncbi:hypothetical protein [Bartonella sp. AP72JLCBS]|uniref:hypothetical protein n=1 Tax=Bartonella sp. AP72JLCBS TaxID=3243502 RepID=UPI0035CFBDB0